MQIRDEYAALDAFNLPEPGAKLAVPSAAGGAAPAAADSTETEAPVPSGAKVESRSATAKIIDAMPKVCGRDRPRMSSYCRNACTPTDSVPSSFRAQAVLCKGRAGLQCESTRVCGVCRKWTVHWVEVRSLLHSIGHTCGLNAHPPAGFIGLQNLPKCSACNAFGLMRCPQCAVHQTLDVGGGVRDRHPLTHSGSGTPRAITACRNTS